MPVNTTVFGNMVFADVIKINEVIRVSPNPMTDVLIVRRGKVNAETDTHREKMALWPRRQRLEQSSYKNAKDFRHYQKLEEAERESP